MFGEGEDDKEKQIYYVFWGVWRGQMEAIHRCDDMKTLVNIENSHRLPIKQTCGVAMNSHHTVNVVAI